MEILCKRKSLYKGKSLQMKINPKGEYRRKEKKGIPCKVKPVIMINPS